MAVNAFEKLVCSACFFINNVLFDEAQQACVIAVPIAHPLFNPSTLLIDAHRYCTRVGVLIRKGWSHALLLRFCTVLHISRLARV